MTINFAGTQNRFQQGMALLQSGRFAEAESTLEQAARENPTHWQAVYFHGVAALEQKKLDLAIPRIKRALELNPKNPSGHYALADIYRQTRTNVEDCLHHYNEAVKLDPKCLGAFAHRATPLLALNRLDEAAETSRTAIRMSGFEHQPAATAPKYVPSPAAPWNPADIMAIASFNLGLITQRQNRTQDAINHYRRAIEFNPRHFFAWTNLAELYFQQQKPVETLQAYDKLIEIDPKRLEPYLNRGIVLARTGRFFDAARMFQFVLDQIASGPPNPKLAATAYRLLGRSYTEWGDVQETFRHYRAAWEINPDDTESHSCWLRMRTYLPDLDSAQWLAEHRDWWTRHAAAITPMTHPAPANPDKKRRIGFISGDFRWHSVAYFLLDLFEHFDRSRFEFYAYSNIDLAMDKADAFTDWFKQKASAWRDIQNLSDADAAALIHNDNIDILIDLAGHTSRNRLLVFAHKPAPVQATWLGCPSTTGSPLIDWRITDTLTDPPGLTEAHYAEKLLRLNRPMWCFRPVSGSGLEQTNILPPAPETPAAPRPFTFGSFAFNKTHAELFDLWIKILHAAPNSRLCLKCMAINEPEFAQKLRDRFAAKGITPDRLHLVKYAKEGNNHLATYHDIDLALDTFPYNGTTNTCEALWMGVPVLTLVGNVHHARVGLSLLTAVGLTDLITYTSEDYIAKAIHLANNPAALLALRKNLRQRFEQSPLMNAPAFAQDFCEALTKMWQDYARPSEFTP